MEPSVYILTLLIIIILVGSACCSGVEAAFLAVNSIRILELASKQKPKGSANQLLKLRKHLGRTLTVITITNNGFNMIDLRSDTVSLPTKQMKDFMFNAAIGDDVYGEDPSINELQEYAANLFNKESALFVPSGTMANLVSVLAHCDRGDEIILGNKSHIFYYEAGGVSAYGGIHSHQLKNYDDGTIDLNDIKDSIRNKGIV